MLQRKPNHRLSKKRRKNNDEVSSRRSKDSMSKLKFYIRLVAAAALAE